MFTPEAIRPDLHARFDPEKMSKSTLFRSDRILVGLNCFEAGQEHRLHTHAGQDKVYHVLSGTGRFVLEDRRSTWRPAPCSSPPRVSPTASRIPATSA